MRLHLVQSQRQVEALAREGLHARTLRALTLDLAEQVAGKRERAGPEVTRLLSEAAAPRPELAELVDLGLGALRRLGLGTTELAELPGARSRLFGRALEQADTALERANLRDERADAWLAAASVAEHTLPGVTDVSVWAWVRLGPAELRLLETLHLVLRSRGGGGVTLRFPGLSGEESRRAVESEQARLEARWSSVNDHPNVVRDEDTPASALRTALIKAPNLESEARAVVRAVQDAIAEGARLDRIAIVPLELAEAFLEELRSALWTARLPFSEPRGRPPVAGPNVHATLELLRLAGGPVRRDALLDVLAAPGLDPTRWFGAGGKRGLASLRALLARTPVSVDFTGDLLLERAAFLAKKQTDSGANAVQALELILADLERMRAPASRAELVQKLTALIGSLGLLRLSPDTIRLALDTRDAGAPGLLTALSDDARGGAALELALLRLVAAAERLGLAQELVTSRQLSAELLRAIEGVGQARGAARAAAIAIARPEDVAGLRLDLAVVCRASAACFSKAGSGASSLWLGAELCEALPRDRKPASARDEEAGTLLALNALLAGAAQTSIIWSTADGTSETAASRFAQALEEQGHAVSNEPGSALSPGARRIARLPAASAEVLARAEIELARQACFFGQRAASHVSGRVQTLSRWLDPALPPLPVTRLERYADCNFLGFAAIVLRAARDESVTDALNPRERGTLIHAAAAEALSAIAGQLEQPEDELLATAQAAAERALSGHAGSALRGAALGSALSDVRSLVRWSLENRSYAFRDAERAFGEGEAWGPLALGSYRLSGRIDRIDLSTDGQRARVIDYKSGQTPSKSDDHALQGWLYARKVATELGATEVESLYLGLSRRVAKPKPIFIGAADAPELLEREQHAFRLLERLNDGHVAADPTRPGRCARCDTRDICRRPLSAPLAEESNDEA